jgi:hypothetical protein
MKCPAGRLNGTNFIPRQTETEDREIVIDRFLWMQTICKLSIQVNSILLLLCAYPLVPASLQFPLSLPIHSISTPINWTEQ